MNENKSLEIFEQSLISKAVLQNALPAMFILGALFHETGLIWAQPAADVLSLVLAAVLYIRKSKKMIQE